MKYMYFLQICEKIVPFTYTISALINTWLIIAMRYDLT